MTKPRRAKSKRLQPLPLDASETKCGICLDVVVKRGKIGPCSHLYCFPCLQEWSKVNNTCPQCKRTFRSITKVDFKTNTTERKVFIKDQTQPPPISSDDDDVIYNSSDDIVDFDTDWIDHNNVADKYSDNEEDAQFTQKTPKRTFSPVVDQHRVSIEPARTLTRKSKRKCRVLLSDSDESLELFGEKTPEKASTFKSPLHSPYNRTKGINCNFVSVISPSRSTTYFTSPKYNKLARWSKLDQCVRKKKRKKATSKITVPIATISTQGKQTVSRWLSTSTPPPPRSKKENTPPSSSRMLENGKFRIRKRQSPKKTMDEEEEYFTRMLGEM